MSPPLEPARAAVRPRVAGDAVPRLLEERVAELLAAGQRTLAWVEAPERCGKTTALRHLAHVFAGETRLCLRDEGHDLPAEGPLVTVQARRPHVISAPGERLRLAAWSDDDCLEYLLHRHEGRVGAAFAKWRAARTTHDLAAWPGLCAAVLDELASHDELAGPGEALDRVVARAAGGHRALLGVRALWRQSHRADDIEPASLAALPQHALLSRAIQVRLAARGLLDCLEGSVQRQWSTPPRWDEHFLAEVVDVMRSEPDRRARLEELVGRSKRRMECELLTVLNAGTPGYRPARDQWSRLAYAWLPGVDLAGCSVYGRLDGTVLRGAVLRAANLTRAGGNGVDLRDADATGLVAEGIDLAHSDLRGARLDAARLRGARLVGCKLEAASLRDADLTHASLARARLCGAELAGCRLEQAWLAGLDLRGARLRGSILAGANLEEARLDGVEAEDLQAEGANLRGADLTASAFARACLRKARLTNAGLAAIDWEGADLRGADLRGATFHMGSSRSGLVASDLASEGTRTGFYTDEALEDSFQAPEDVRKANLRRADLRGAKMDGVDFYLVDLRGALLDAAQREWVERCKAIVDPRD